MMNDDKISKEIIMTNGNRHEYENVFSYQTLEYLFECRADKTNILKRKESAELEVKENFNWGDKAKYGKLFCSFANNKGGYVIFGIKDKPHKLVGLRSDNFSRKDPAKITEYLNSRFSPTIEWEPYDHEIDGKNFGIIYIYPTKEKPVMCINNDANVMKEGEIYYRYSGETKIIRATDLQKIINERIEAEKKSWQDMIFRLAKESPNNLALLNLEGGTLEEGGTKVLIDEDLLSKLKFIKEGKFVEKGGEPTLRLLGDVQPISGAILPTKKVPSGIHRDYIYKAFFNGECGLPLRVFRSAGLSNSETPTTMVFC
ncbi:putative transcriptional regulator, contains HTH domain [Candidatus Methanophagaceae archaeon]|nr:putative transcriptional regulator, contains HTH domain [Methanophagales archaeon]